MRDKYCKPSTKIPAPLNKPMPKEATSGEAPFFSIKGNVPPNAMAPDKPKSF